MNVIAEFCFHGCTSLTTVTIPNGVHTIQQGAFAHCSSLETLILPLDGVENIEGGAFEGCSCLTEIVLGKANKIYNDGSWLVRNCHEELIAEKLKIAGVSAGR